MTTLPFRFHISGLVLAALLIGASIIPAPAQTAATPMDPADQAPKRKKMVERAAAVMKALGDASAKRGQKLPALADYYAAKADLKSIDPSAPEAPRAKKLLAAMQKNEREYVRKLGSNNIDAKLDSLAGNVEGRRKFATDTRKQMSRRGLSMDIGTSDEHETVLSIKYFKMDRPTVLSLARSGKIFDRARDLGFRSVIFTDGRLTWTYDVAANSFK
ncbi:hypothetical protein HNQ36_001008 [Afipia massiliensis]|uniref:Uncharacterized protein n=1 Tax=Afipia massiliensis TaxID=211460 RepID=A0A840MXB3_9BRAD|nr:hypothetical protein [Afipia massiliensis]MBB5051054.1 hypothetical protein [Afipia massiliensis]